MLHLPSKNSRHFKAWDRKGNKWYHGVLENLEKHEPRFTRKFFRSATAAEAYAEAVYNRYTRMTKGA